MPGVRAGKTAIVPGKSSNSGWNPLTLVVEDAQPTHVVITGLIANTTSVVGDFVISGITATIDSISRDITNKIITVVLSVAVNNGDIFSIVYKGKTYSVTNNIAAWTPLKPLGGETPSLYVKKDSRSGLTLVDSVAGNNLTVVPACFITSGNTQYFDYAGNNTDFDIGITDYTIIIAARLRANAITTNWWGKLNAPNSGSGSYLIYQANTGIYHAYVKSSGTSVDIATSAITDQNIHVHEIRINNTTKKVSYYFDGTQVGSDTSFTGTFGSDTAKFGMQPYAASYNQVTGYTEGAVLKRLITPEERTNIVNGIYPSDCFWHGVFTGQACTDVSGGNRHLTGTGITEINTDYNTKGSQSLLNNGYTVYEKLGSKDIHIPMSNAKTRVTSAIVPTGYTIRTTLPDVVGDLLNFNCAKSYVAIPSMDRSNTTNFSYLARNTTLNQYYNATYKAYLHSQEFTNAQISNYANDATRGLAFSKIVDGILQEYYFYATNKTGTDYEKAIKHSTESGVLKFDVTTGPHICAISDDGLKVLKFDDVHTFSLSTDGGVTYPITLLTTLSSCDVAGFATNGNIGFGDATKMYYSSDNLATYHESTVTGADGNAYSGGTLGNFRPWKTSGNFTTKGTSLFMWMNYPITGTCVIDNINLWGTKDGFVNVKSYYKFNYSEPTAYVRHGHDIQYDSLSDTILIQTGDDLLDSVLRNNVMQGTYTSATDSFAISIIGRGAQGTIWEGGGFVFKGDYYYSSGEDLTPRGVRRGARNDLANYATNQTQVFITGLPSIYFGLIGDYIIMGEGGAGGSDYISFSLDGLKYFTRRFPQLTPLVPYGTYIGIGKLSSGYIVFQCIEAGETLDNYTKGNTLLVKPTIIS
jgi:hypothetical protein